MKRSRRPKPRIRHPFIEIAGDVYMVRHWFEIDDGKRGRDELTLVRLTPKELRLYDWHSAVGCAVGSVEFEVQGRLGERKRLLR